MENTSKSEDGEIKPKITLLSIVPPKRGSLRPSSTRFETNSKQEIPSSSISTPVTLRVPSSPSVPFVPLRLPISKPVTKPAIPQFRLFPDLTSVTPKHSVIIKDDPCTQYNFFNLNNFSCFIDSLLFGLLHKLENNFIIDLLKARELPDTSKENCRTTTIDAIVGLHRYIHDKAQPIKKSVTSKFRELLYKCDTQREKFHIPKSVYTSTQQDPHDFIGKILNIINLPQFNYNETKIYTRPTGDPELVREFPEYKPERNINTNHSLLIYTITKGSSVIDIAFRQIDDNSFAFDTPEEITEFERADGEYPNIIEYIHKNNMIAENVKLNIREHDPDLAEFFNDEKISQKKIISLYKDIYHAHIMVFSQESRKSKPHYKYRDDLPKLTYTRSAISKIYVEPINFFVISIARENSDGTKNKLELVNLPERIQIAGKTLQLVSAVVHYGMHLSKGHYICYFKCGNHWYIMDNMLSDIRQYAPFDIKNREIMSQCRLLIYM